MDFPSQNNLRLLLCLFFTSSLLLPLLLACLHVFPLPCAPFFSASSKIKTAALYIANALSWRRSWKMSPTILRVWRPRLRRYGSVCVFPSARSLTGCSVHPFFFFLPSKGLQFNPHKRALQIAFQAVKYRLSNYKTNLTGHVSITWTPHLQLPFCLLYGCISSEAKGHICQTRLQR